jgi:uncharacterized protein YndB with AHSA1/START domain
VTVETATAVRKEIRVRATLERAFEVFTAGIATWWPLAGYSVYRAEAETVVLEAGEGGRIYERARGGEESDWGRILVWDPPHRLAFTWHPGQSDGPETEVEVRFTAAGDATDVVLEHRGWERYGDAAAEIRGEYNGGWDEVLAGYREQAG